MLSLIKINENGLVSGPIILPGVQLGRRKVRFCQWKMIYDISKRDKGGGRRRRGLFRL